MSAREQLLKENLRTSDAFIPAMNTIRFLEGKRRILIIGDAGGRDWKALSKRSEKEVHVLDIASQPGIDNLVVQSIEERTPYEDGFFDGIVVNEVLEHLFRDVDALEEINRILADDGVLVVTVPYLSQNQDQAEFHVRVHSIKTMRRLLERCGFKQEVHFFRGLGSRLPQWGPTCAALTYLQLFSMKILGKSAPEAIAFVNGGVDALERFLGTSPLLSRFQKCFESYGGIMKARKTTKKNFDELQVSEFENKVY